MTCKKGLLKTIENRKGDRRRHHANFFVGNVRSNSPYGAVDYRSM
ncbi:hypothetical protein [Paraburkholderia hospita]|nr:hypothetical protein [Paraburkholderia hospita]EUC18436.1 hypothetical protein PMI06_003342 [Burkholderia sp. BT03]SKC77096.1 hypothetical protein SAMN06266956_3021 [Paraburkholderia hospita]